MIGGDKMYKYIKYDEWVSDHKIICFVDFLTDQEQNGSSVHISFDKFLEMPGILFKLYFIENYIWNEIISDFEIYRNFINRVELCYRSRKNKN